MVKDILSPSVSRGSVKIKVAYSCISAGTEMMVVRNNQKSVVNAVLQNPRMAIDYVLEKGLKKAIDKADYSKELINATGYSVSGEVVEVGTDVKEFKVGDLVSAGGAGFASHAEYVVVPKNLVVKCPQGLKLEYASMGTVGSIAMHGVRRCDLSLGEYAVVIGCGLMGLLAIQILKASGVKVACTDLSESRLNMAKLLGADKIINSGIEDPVFAVQNWTNGHGADAVLFTAATHSSEPLSQSFKMCRRKGKVVLLGVSGMEIKREDIYKNEIDFQISTSYGPGRYDPEYEEKGMVYPYAYVRWTENRNIECFLNMVAEGKVDIDSLTPKVYNIEQAKEAFDGIQSLPDTHIVTILQYSSVEEKSIRTISINGRKTLNKDIVRIGLIGAGGFATGTLLPIIADNPDKFYLKSIYNRTAIKAINAAKQFKAEQVVSDYKEIIKDPDVDLVMICTRHGNHAELLLEALKEGKNVYVEKPLATTLEQLGKIEAFYQDDTYNHPCLYVGFNRRFSPYISQIKKHLDGRSSPVLIHYRMNAGFMPSTSWIHEDGGRIIGEGCHIIDLANYLIGSKVVSYNASSFNPSSGVFLNEDNRSISFEYEDGSVAVIDYFSCGSKELPKEMMEVHFEKKSIIMEDYKTIKGYGIKLDAKESKDSIKGHKEEWLSLYDSIRNGKNYISLEELFDVTRLSILTAQNL